VEGVTLTRDAAKITLASGTIAFGQPVQGRVFAAAFRGKGSLQVAPMRPMEIQQLQFHTQSEVLDQSFTEAVFTFSDPLFEEISREVRFVPRDVEALQSLYADRINTLMDRGTHWEHRVLKALLAADPARHRFFRAEFKTEPFGWVTLTLDASEAEEFELSRHDDSQSRVIVDTWVRQPAGNRSIEEAYRNWEARHEYGIERYRMDASVDSLGELTATTTMELKIQQPGERVLLFTLDPNLRVSRIQDGAGRRWAFFQPREPKDVPFLGEYLVAVAPEPILPGPLTLEFAYVGKRVVRKEGSGVYFAQSWGWYPGNWNAEITFAARAHFELVLRVPKRFQAVAVGKKVEESVEGDLRVTRWQSEIPLAVAGFAFGEYNVKTEQVGKVQVEVYANKNPDDMLRTIEIIAEGPMPEQNPRINPLGGLGSLSPTRLLQEMATEMANSVRVFERYFGPYPYGKLSMSNIAAFRPWGQGWPGLIYLSALSSLDPSQRQQLGLGGNEPELTDRWRSHEVSHQWWGHAVSWRSYHDQWLSEGFAEYSGMLYTYLRRGPAEFFSSLRWARNNLFYKDNFGAVNERIGPIYAGRRLRSAKHPRAYSIVVYEKGAWVLHMLRMMLFDTHNPQDPDHRFVAMMQEFTKTFYNRAASTEDFKRIVEKHMTPQMDMDGNGRMDWFFNQWVYGTGIPQYWLTYTVEPGKDPGSFVLKGRLRQSGVPESFKMPVPLYFTKGKNTFLAGWVPAIGPETPIEVPLNFRPDKITLNEQEDILCLVGPT